MDDVAQPMNFVTCVESVKFWIYSKSHKRGEKPQGTGGQAIVFWKGYAGDCFRSPLGIVPKINFYYSTPMKLISDLKH